MADDAVEQMLLSVATVSLFKIPPRANAGGVKSGEWRVADKIFTGRLRVVSIGPRCEVRLESSTTGELFACCPVPLGERAAAVECASDSSRNFVLRLDDGAGHRALVGLSFTERDDAFNFNVALAGAEKWARSEAASAANANPFGDVPAGAFKLRDGEKLHVAVPAAKGAVTASASSRPALAGGPRLMPLAPPPGDMWAVSDAAQPAAAAPAPRPGLLAPPAGDTLYASFGAPSQGGPSFGFGVDPFAKNPFGPPPPPKPPAFADDWAKF